MNIQKKLYLVLTTIGIAIYGITLYSCNADEQIPNINVQTKDFSQYLYPTVTVLHVSVAEMAANAMHLVLTILQNDLHMTLSKLHVTKLIYGESFQEKPYERTP